MSLQNDFIENEIEETLEQSESKGNFSKEILISDKKLAKISKTDLTIHPSEIFVLPNFINKFINRKRHIFYGASQKEFAIHAQHTYGKIGISLLTKKDIDKAKQKIDLDDNKNLFWVTIGAIRIQIRSTLSDKIDQPIMMSLIDERIQNPVEGCLGSLSGNLARGKLIFTVHPRLSVSLHDQDFDGILSFVHKYGRTDLVKDNNVPFSISYLVSYAIHNQHNMTIVKEPKGIKMDPLFSDYLEHKETEFDWLVQPSRKSLEIDLFENRTLVKEQNPLLLKTSSMRQKPTILLTERRSDAESSHERQLKQISNTVSEMAKILLPSS
ncbi:Uncharacterized protein Adt_30783 [Abeliophyllum distichum]|uniref:Movement protein n=1 Tax=Abeliophyllum distichum TaxID=126358 RepID=A0ABD1RC88_9LAMI